MLLPQKAVLKICNHQYISSIKSYKAPYNSLLFEVLSNIAVAISIDELSRSRLTPGVGLRLAVLDVGRDVVTREPPDLDSPCCQPSGIDATFVVVEGLAVRA